MSQQGLLQQSIRGITGTALDYNGDWLALMASDSITTGSFHERQLAWINQTLATSHGNLPAARQAFAESQGYANWSSMGAITVNGVSAEVGQFFDRLLTPPAGAREALYADLIDGLVEDGVWAKLDVLYLFAAADEATALTNLVQSAYQAERYTSASAQTFTADQGWTGGSFLTKINSKFNPSTASSPKFTQNDAHIAVWRKTTTQSNSASVAALVTAGASTRILPKWSDGNTTWGVNSSSNQDSLNVAANNGAGFMLAQRTGASAKAIYQDGSQIATSTITSTAPMNEEIVFAPCPGLVMFGSIGSSLTSGEITAYTNRVTTFLTGVGVIP